MAAEDLAQLVDGRDGEAPVAPDVVDPRQALGLVEPSGVDEQGQVPLRHHEEIWPGQVDIGVGEAGEEAQVGPSAEEQGVEF